MQAALERELAEVDQKAKQEGNDDKAMAGTEEKDEEDAVSDTGSEDLEADSSEDDEEDEEEDGGEGDEDVEMGEGEEKVATATETNGTAHKQEVMAH